MTMPLEIIDNTHPAEISRPRPPKISTPSIDVALAQADAAGERAASAAAEERAARNDALRLSTRIESLRKRRDVLATRLRTLEAHDIPGHRARCEASVEKFLDAPGLDARDSNELNSAILTLGGLEALERLLPKITSTVRVELSAVTSELGKLESK
jgi:hypothetical protein